jgi:hypothetical protein
MYNNCDNNSDASFDSINCDNELHKSLHFSNDDIESINRISNSHEYKLKQRKKISYYTKLFVKAIFIFLIILINIPICVTELYYAFTDVSCIHIKNNNILFNLYIYLSVDGIYGIVCTVLCCLYIYYFIDVEKKQLIWLKKIIIKIILILLLLFNLSWITIGSVIFWSLIDNYMCNNNIYSFIFAELIIKFLFLFLQIIVLSNKT